MFNYAQTLVSRQTERDDPRQVKNHAGGYVFKLEPMQQLRRFLILGTEGGSYYAGAREMTRENAGVVKQCLDADAKGSVAQIVEVSTGGLAPKNSPAIFALALAASHDYNSVRSLALDALPKVCRTGTHLFEFVEYVNQMRGWGRGLKDAVGKWYTGKDANKLAYQVVKYQQRGGWSHRDVLRKAHPTAKSSVQNSVLHWATQGGVQEMVPPIIEGYEKAKSATTAAEVAHLVEEYGLTREMVPTKWLNDLGVWEALLVHMPMTAMVRNLGKMTSCGVLKPLNLATRTVVDRLSNGELLRRARLHPINVLVAACTYGNGRGFKGSLAWRPIGGIVDALDDAFYASFEFVEPTGKNHLLALDVSGSMTWPAIGCMGGMTPRELSAAMAMVTARTEPNYQVVAFSDSMQDVNITARMRLNDVIETIGRIPMGGTDCALPMLHAARENLDVDMFVVYTDNETWCGEIHPSSALRAYRTSSGRDARLAVNGMTATSFSIADPSDLGMMDFVGFDSSMPKLLADFARGEV